MTVSITLAIALVLDYCLGEPKKGHPLVVFGHFALFLENRLHPSEKAGAEQQILMGTVALLLAVLPITVLTWLVTRPAFVDLLLSPIILYLCIAPNSLKQHALAVHNALQTNNIDNARQQVSMIVSRETEQMDELAVTRAGIESVLENGADAIFAALFWFVIAGAPGVVAYRLCNTLDAMWGYKSPRYRHFGMVTARLDDILNWLPARLTAFSYALLGQTKTALNCWHTQAHLLESPNGGPVMTAGAGALNIKLGGAATYHGKLKHKPLFGGSHNPDKKDIIRANQLITATLTLWTIIIILGDSLA